MTTRRADRGVLAYAFASSRRAPLASPDTLAFSYHKRNALAAVLYTALVASIVEMIAVHFLIRAIAPRVAIGVLIVSLFGAVWILGFARSVALRPILVSRDAILIRTGALWSIDIARRNIARIEFGRVHAPAKGTPEYFRAAPGQPNVLIDLHEMAVARGPYGITRPARRIGLSVDDLAGFERALS